MGYTRTMSKEATPPAHTTRCARCHGLAVASEHTPRGQWIYTHISAAGRTTYCITHITEETD